MDNCQKEEPQRKHGEAADTNCNCHPPLGEKHVRETSTALCVPITQLNSPFDEKLRQLIEAAREDMSAGRYSSEVGLLCTDIEAVAGKNADRLLVVMQTEATAPEQRTSSEGSENGPVDS